MNYWDSLYKKTGSNSQSPFTVAMHEKILNVIPSDVISILDAGCGGGALMSFLSSRNKYELEGVDISESGVASVVEKLKMKASVGDVCDLNQFHDNSFDLVICSEVTEHLSLADYVCAIDELMRIAKKYVIVTNPYKEKLTYHQVECKHCLSRFHPIGHIHSIDETFIKDNLKPHSKSIDIFFSGVRGWCSLLYSGVMRFAGYQLVSDLGITCPLCKEPVPDKRWSIFVKLFGYAYRKLQFTMRIFGVYTYANIIVLARKK